MRVARRHEPILGDEGERKRARESGNRLDQCVIDGARLRPRKQVQHDLGVAVGLENGALPHQFVANLAGVHDVAVVTDAHLTVHTLDEQRLRIRHRAFTGRRVAGVADGHMSWKRC